MPLDLNLLLLREFMCWAAVPPEDQHKEKDDRRAGPRGTQSSCLQPRLKLSCLGRLCWVSQHIPSSA